jgi:hypothetical protein
MVWKVLRPQVWLLDRKVRAVNRAVVAALFLLLGFGGQWVYTNVIRDNLALLATEEGVAFIASSLPLGLALLLLFGMLGVGDVMHQLYLTSSVEVLLVAPVASRTIFAVKLLQSSRATLIPATGFGVFLVALGLARGAPASYYVLLVLLLLAAMALITALVMTLVILLARLLPPQKVRAWMPVVLVMATFALGLGQQPAAQWFAGQDDLITFLTQALLNPGQLGLVVAGLGGLALVSSLAAYRIFDTAFHEGWDRFREVPTQPKPVSPAARRRWGMSRLVRPLPAPLRFFLVKEWLELRRDPQGLISLSQPLIVVVAVVLIPVLSSGGDSEVLQPLLFLSLLMFLALLLGMVPVGSSLMAIAQEGRRLALLRSLPISMSALLQGKFWATWVPMALSWALVFLAAGIWLRFPLWQIGFLVGITTWGLAGAAAATVAMGGLAVDFKAEELRQRTPTLTSYLVMALNAIFVLLAMGTGLWLVARLVPDSSVVQALQTLAGSPLVGWIFAGNLWVPLVLASSQIVFWAGVGALWAAAVRRLDAWEEG